MWEEHLEKNKPLFLTELAHQTWDSYHDESAMVSKASNVPRRDLHYRRLERIFVWQPFALYNAIPSGVPKKLLMGPWTHGRPDTQIPGPNIEYLGELLRWFDEHLKGIDTGILNEPPITLFANRYDEPARRRQVNSGEWRYENEWPLKRAKDTPMYIHPGGLLAKEIQNSSPNPDNHDYDPTVGTASRLWNTMGWDTCLPADQRTDEMLSIVYTSSPLEEDTEVTGDPTVVLYASVTAEVAAFSVKLNDVAPDGRSEQVTRGILNGTHRSSHTNPEKLKPGEVYEIESRSNPCRTSSPRDTGFASQLRALTFRKFGLRRSSMFNPYTMIPRGSQELCFRSSLPGPDCQLPYLRHQKLPPVRVEFLVRSEVGGLQGRRRLAGLVGGPGKGRMGYKGQQSTFCLRYDCKCFSGRPE